MNDEDVDKFIEESKKLMIENYEKILKQLKEAHDDVLGSRKEVPNRKTPNP